MEERKYTVLAFVAKCENKSTDVVAMKKLLQEINVKTYVPYSKKVFMAREIIKNICVTENDGFRYDSPKRFLAYVMSIIEIYTDLVMNEEDTSIEYDALKSSGVLTAIFDAIGKDDFKEYQTVWKMVYEDYVNNTASIPSLIKENVKRFGIICNEGLKAVAEELKKIPLEEIKDRLAKTKPAAKAQAKSEEKVTPFPTDSKKE